MHTSAYSALRQATGGGGTTYLAPYSGDDWQETFREEQYWFRQNGFNRMKLLSIASPEEFRAGLADARSVWFCGGLQSLQMRRLSALPGATDALRQAHQAGVVMAGISAGAAVMTGLMISGGSRGNVNTGRGLGFLPGLVLDQHVVKRHREYRLQKVIAQNPELIGVGINEDTAVTFQGSQFKVVGAGPVIVTHVTDGKLAEVKLRGGNRFDLVAMAKL